MSKIITFHSFRRGTGKSSLTANVAALLMLEGQRVGVIDADLASPGVHVLFKLDENKTSYWLNDYLWGRCQIEQAACDVTPSLPMAYGAHDGTRTGPGAPRRGRIWLVPSSTETREITQILRGGYDANVLGDGFQTLIRSLSLDTLIVDTRAGLNEETLASIAGSDVLAVLLRLDQQDYQGTDITVEIARRLGVPRTVLVINEAPASFDLSEIKAQVEQTYHCEVVAVMPHSAEMMVLDSRGLFVLHYPNHPMTALIKHITARLMA